VLYLALQESGQDYTTQIRVLQMKTRETHGFRSRDSGSSNSAEALNPSLLQGYSSHSRNDQF
jgi:hypothetical protein